MTSPSIWPASQCDQSLQFISHHHWPAALPGLAINHIQISGFGRDLVFNHEIPSGEVREKSLGIFLSVYPEMSFIEAARFHQVAQGKSWIPLSAILENWNFRLNDQWALVAARALDLPLELQNWLADKKVGPHELAFLPTQDQVGPELWTLWCEIGCVMLALRPSKSQGLPALELLLETMLMQTPTKSAAQIRQELCPAVGATFENWILALKHLRFPHAQQIDQTGKEKALGLPWPAQSQVRWVRQGDRSGIELRLTLNDPSELKKSLLSLQKIQDLLDQSPESLWPKH